MKNKTQNRNRESFFNLIWSAANILRNNFKSHDFCKIILPFVVLRRIDCVLSFCKLNNSTAHNLNKIIDIKSDLIFIKLINDKENVVININNCVQKLTPEVREIFDRFVFSEQIVKLQKTGILYQVIEHFANFNLSPDTVSNHDMGLIFEALIRKFAEVSNETAGEHFTPRDVIKLMVNLLFIGDSDILNTGVPVVRTIYDPTAGTGGMLSVSEEHLLAQNPSAKLTMFGQELNDESYAICKADMLIKGQDAHNIFPGNTLSEDGHGARKFDYMLSNPPFGVEWKKVEKEVRREHEQMGHAGRFGPGLPRISDGSLLFLLHLLSKMRPATDGGSRIGIVLNGSPLFTGGAGSGESEIRRHVLENDLAEAIIALPTDMFFNTGIATYVWVLSNRKPVHRRGLVQLIDASAMWQKMRKSLGSKRREMGERDIDAVTRLFGDCMEAQLATVTDAEGKASRMVVRAGEAPPTPPAGGTVKLAPLSRLFPNEAFGYRSITVERPLLDAAGKPVLGQKGRAKGKPQPDPARRGTENVPLAEDVAAYFAREVLPHAADAWIDEEKTKVGYEIPFNRHFYVFGPPRPLVEIDAELKQVTGRIMAMLGELAA